MYECAICGTRGDFPCLMGREIQFGTGELFPYFRCLNCGCLQIAVPLQDMGKYYPPEYYSFSEVSEHPLYQLGRLSRLRFYFSEYYNLTGKGWLGRWLYNHRTDQERILGAPVTGWLKSCVWNRRMRILDVGCGVGNVLHYLHHMGFKHLTGIDPFNSEDRIIDSRLGIFKRSLYEQQGEFDLIMSSHSLEHMSNQHAVIEKMKSLLAPDGTLVIRIPVFSEYMFGQFGDCWQAWDPPRHFYIHSIDSIRYLLESHQLKIDQTIFDATNWQYGMSYFYKYHDGDMESLKSLFKQKPVTDPWVQNALQTTERLNAEQQSDCCSLIVHRQEDAR